MRKTSWLTVILALLGVAQAAPLTFNVGQGFDVTVPLRAGSSERVRISLASGASDVIVRLGNRSERLRVGTVADDFEPKGSVLVADVNFDGWLDVLTPASTGYGGVNYFFDVYVFDAKTRRFPLLEFPGDGGPQLCNPEPRTAQRILLTNCKSGPAWYTADYRFAAGKPYLYRRSEMVPFDGFNPGDLLYKLNIFDAQGKLIRRLWADDPTAEKPAVRVIARARVYFYDRPDEASRSARYVVRGDRVEVLELLESDVGWVRVAYQSRKLGRIVRWLYLG